MAIVNKGAVCHTARVADPIEQLINEVRLLYQSLVQIGDELHAGTNLSMGMRAVLEYLERDGKATVPTIARDRRVTRQRIQTLVNALIERGLVLTVDNPASKRSPLVELSAAGAKTIRDMRRKEGRELRVDVSAQRVRDATATLAAIREALESARRD